MDKTEEEGISHNKGKVEGKNTNPEAHNEEIVTTPTVKSSTPSIEGYTITSGDKSIDAKKQLSPEKIAKLKSMFDTIDIEKKGAVSSIDAMNIVQTLWKEWYPCKRY